MKAAVGSIFLTNIKLSDALSRFQPLFTQYSLPESARQLGLATSLPVGLDISAYHLDEVVGRLGKFKISAYSRSKQVEVERRHNIAPFPSNTRIWQLGQYQYSSGVSFGNKVCRYLCSYAFFSK
jgi:hypothetical protein